MKVASQQIILLTAFLYSLHPQDHTAPSNPKRYVLQPHLRLRKLRPRVVLSGAPDHTSRKGKAGLPPNHQEMKITCPSPNLPSNTDSNDEPLGAGLCVSV